MGHWGYEEYSMDMMDIWDMSGYSVDMWDIGYGGYGSMDIWDMGDMQYGYMGYGGYSVWIYGIWGVCTKWINWITVESRPTFFLRLGESEQLVNVIFLFITGLSLSCCSQISSMLLASSEDIGWFVRVLFLEQLFFNFFIGSYGSYVKYFCGKWT